MFALPWVSIVSSQVSQVALNNSPLPIIEASADRIDSAAGADRRLHIRRGASDLPWLDRLRLKYGPNAAVIDLSRGGAQIETEGHRLRPGSTIVLQMSTSTSELTIPARVLRCHIAGFSPQAIYRSALAFRRQIELPEPEAAQTQSDDTETRETNPLHEQARLSLAFSRWLEANQPSNGVILPGKPSLIFTLGADEMAATRALIEAPSGRRGGAPFNRALSRLFKIVTAALREGLEPRAIIAQIVEQLRRVVPARAIRVVEGASIPRTDADEQIYFDIPGGDGAPVKLFVDLRSESLIEEWQFLYLKAGVRLLSLARKIEHALATLEDQAAALADQNGDDPAEDTPVAVEPHRVVVRYADGRLLKGYSHDFAASSGCVAVAPTIDAPPNARITVPFGQLKAIFFVRTFEGDPAPLEIRNDIPPKKGRRVKVTFLDGETLTGATLNYHPDAAGFFVQPLDERGNNIRVFVAARAIRHVQFP
jgi:hypothetical protein